MTIINMENDIRMKWHLRRELMRDYLFVPTVCWRRSVFSKKEKKNINIKTILPYYLAHLPSAIGMRRTLFEKIILQIGQVHASRLTIRTSFVWILMEYIYYRLGYACT